MNVTLERTEESILKYEMGNAIKFNNRLLKEITGSSFLFEVMGKYNGIHLTTLDHLITKYEKERNITVLERRAIEKITKAHLSMVIIKLKGFDYSIIKQWIAETEGELIELVNKYNTIVEKR